LNDIDDNEYWKIILPTSRELFNGIPVDSKLDDLVCGRSVTEWEGRIALKNESNINRCSWIRTKRFSDELSEIEKYLDIRTLNDYFDTIKNSTLRLYLDNFKAFLESTLISHGGTVIDCPSVSIKSYIEDPKSMDFFLDISKELFVCELNKIIHLKESWEIDGCGMEINGKYLTEFLGEI
jgi:hypothetical protein